VMPDAEPRSYAPDGRFGDLRRRESPTESRTIEPSVRHHPQSTSGVYSKLTATKLWLINLPRSP
ncbi:hypothetical protein NKG95_33790, partial [Mesorhizobium sp. M1423]|uniref:hypothetical protein n=1 Tax=Mesorhizobium sp. M1423 TaxID=2957101 RepID=UPI00333AE9E5